MSRFRSGTRERPTTPHVRDETVRTVVLQSSTSRGDAQGSPNGWLVRSGCASSTWVSPWTGCAAVQSALPERSALERPRRHGPAGSILTERRFHAEETSLAATLQTALVTGAGSGIGRSIATTLSEMGLRVALVGRDREKLERNQGCDLAKGRDSAFVATCDIADRSAVKSLDRPGRAALSERSTSWSATPEPTSGTGASSRSIPATGIG